MKNNLKIKLRQCDQEIVAYVSELEQENKRLNKELAKCRVQLLSANNLNAELKKLRPVAKVIISGLGKRRKT